VSYRGGEEESAVPDMSPEEAASVYVGPETGYETAEHVLKALTHVAAAEISAEPGVRAWLRGVVRRKACVWTQPTPAGTEAIDPFHPLAGVKRLQEKPVCDFDGSEFAATLKAHREGLIKLRIALPDRVVDEIVATPKPRTCSSSPRPWRTPGTRCGARRWTAASSSTW
jgi:transcription elongation factor SPT6